MLDKLRRLKERASVLCADGKLRDALKLYQRVVQEDSRELACLIEIGDLHKQLGEQEAAVEAYEVVAHAYAEDGLLLKAIAVCKRILELDEEHTVTQAMLAELYARRRTVPVPPLPLVFDSSKESDLSMPNGQDSLSAWLAEGELDEVPYDERNAGLWTIRDGEVLVKPSVIDRVESITDVVAEDKERLAARQAWVHCQDDESEYDEYDESVDFEQLPLIPLFSELPKKAFIELLVRMKMHQVRRGMSIINQGDAGDSFYILASGLVSVWNESEGSKPILLTHLSSGAFFGEMALLGDGVRTASVKAEEDSQVFEISRDLLDQIIENYPTVATAVRNFYRQRLLATMMSTHALFSPLEPTERALLSEQFRSRSFAEGEVIIEEGKRGNALYLILHGRVQVSRVEDEEVENPKYLAELSSGDLFGEMSLLTGESTNATITALEDTFMLRLPKKRFDELVMTQSHVLPLLERLSAQRSEINDVHCGQLKMRGAVVV